MLEFSHNLIRSLSQKQIASQSLIEPYIYKDDIKDKILISQLKKGEQLNIVDELENLKKFEIFKDKCNLLNLDWDNTFDYFNEQKQNKLDEDKTIKLEIETNVLQFQFQNKYNQNKSNYKNIIFMNYLLQKEEDYFDKQKQQNKGNDNEENVDFFGFTQEVRQELKQLLEIGFKDWNKKEFFDSLLLMKSIVKIQRKLKLKLLMQEKLQGKELMAFVKRQNCQID
ncbi:unnamed protein product [Paramecium sonneborni]|uniref:Uncharacterized protein n=1 Tax=Paramecium sonneborni TaxID=65129 RepID=A0A8S1RS55_9CILI|nr:unnamed protein product [Paramecium sonneborni]